MAQITLQEGTTGTTFVAESTITMLANKSIDVLKVKVLPTLEVNINDEVLYYDKDNNFIFGGYVKEINNEDLKILTVYDYGAELIDTIINEVYYNLSPEAILEDIITNKTSLTFDSTINTGLTISKIVFRDEKAIDVVNKLTQLFDGVWNTDNNKVFLLRLKNEEASNNQLIEGVDKNISGWTINTDKQATKVIVKGAKYVSRTIEELSGTGTEFIVSRTPRDVRVTVGGVELTQTVEGQIDGDYTVDANNKKIIFNTSQTDPIIEYSYDSQIRVTAGSGDIEKEIVKPYIESMNEARILARKYLETYKDGILTATFRTNSIDLTGYEPNKKIYVKDEYRTPIIADYFTISKTVRKFPGTVEVTIGEVEENIFDWQKETQERIKQLEGINQNNDFIQIYEWLKQGLRIRLSASITRLQYRLASGNNFYLSHPERGLLNNTTYIVKTDSDMGEWTDII